MAQNRTVVINGLSGTKFVSNSISTTKYNVFTFIPRFLFEQFRKYANIYFLGIALLQQIPDVSPTGRFTTLVPLCIILTISAIREIVEDFKRKRSDDATNNRKVTAMSHGEWKVLKWVELEVGYIVKIHNEEHFPADLLLLSSSEQNGMCYIETSNLDGETNLKIRQALPQTSNLLTEEDLSNCHGVIECENPNKFLYDFVGNLQMSTELKMPVGPDQILLRGSRLKNTKWIYGVIVYSGFDTKLMLNSSKSPLKRSTVDKVVNRQVLMLFCVLLILSWSSALGSYFFAATLEDNHWYLGFQGDFKAGNILYSLLTFIILYNNLIPISLQVTMEMVKFTQAIFIGWDIDMYYEPTGTYAVARTSNLNEELGQVQYIFSDKTGTLTCNIMTLKCCYIGGIVYGREFEDENIGNQPANTSANSMVGYDEDWELNSSFNARNYSDEKLNCSSNAVSGNISVMSEKKKLQFSPHYIKDIHKNKQVYNFFVMCAVCHGVVPETDDRGEINYQAASPDERALVLAAKKVGFVFIQRTPDMIVVLINETRKEYKILNVIEFTSSRKRMSIIVRDPDDNKIKVMVKGADNVILSLMSNESKKVTDELNDNLNTFAVMGLRTLCFAQRNISESVYNDWSKKFYAASTSMNDREKQIAEVAELIETDLTLVGASAIEDKLQDGVPNCIHNLLKAGIKIWVLTGDKRETAINIGISCKLISPDMNIVKLSEVTVEDTKLSIARLLDEQRKKYIDVENNDALIIEGKTLTFAMQDDNCKDFLALAIVCKVVLCCRVSPSQKAEVVRLVKKECHAVTLAIGDGANDVGMIQEAHVGVGISGQEGLQAVCASDYAIGQFQYLQKLLLVHGHWNYVRVTKLILFCFFKNICFYFCEFWYALLSAFSGQIIFERWTIGLYNVVFTAMPPLAIGMFDQVASSHTLMNYPYLYKLPQSGELFNVKVFWLWCLNAVYVSIIVFWIPCGAMKHDIVFDDGKVNSLIFLGNIVYTFVIVTICMKALIEMNVWNKVVCLLTLGSIVLWLVFLPIYCHLWPAISFAEVMVGMDYYMFTSSIFYILLLIVPFSALLRDVVAKIIYRHSEFGIKSYSSGRSQASKEGSDAFKPKRGRKFSVAAGQVVNRKATNTEELKMNFLNHPSV